MERKIFTFQEWLLEHHAELELHEDWRRLAKNAALGAAVTTSAILGKGHSHSNSPLTTPKAVVSSEVNIQTKLVDAINQKYNTQISPQQVEMIRPVDVIKPMYGDQWNNVYQRAKQAQTTEKIGDIEFPAFNQAAVTNVDKLHEPVPVIFADPALFGEPTANGLCTSIVVDGKVMNWCVVKNKQLLHTIRHELSHATQGILGGTLGDEKQNDLFNRYLMDEKELGVRLAEMKRNYYQLTQKVVTSDSQSLSEMLKHFLQNSEQYSPDVQQLKATIQLASKQGLLPRLLDYLQQNVDKVVNTKQPGNYYA